MIFFKIDLRHFEFFLHTTKYLFQDINPCNFWDLTPKREGYVWESPCNVFSISSYLNLLWHLRLSADLSPYGYSPCHCMGTPWPYCSVISMHPCWDSLSLSPDGDSFSPCMWASSPYVAILSLSLLVGTHYNPLSLWGFILPSLWIPSPCIAVSWLSPVADLGGPGPFIKKVYSF